VLSTLGEASSNHMSGELRALCPERLDR
jgi:hypothetical protein